MQKIQANDKSVTLTVKSSFSDCGIDDDMETAIEKSSCSYNSGEIVLTNPYGLVMTIRHSEFDTSYSIVDGYNEGEGNLGGETSRPSINEYWQNLSYSLPCTIPSISINDFLDYYRLPVSDAYDDKRDVVNSFLQSIEAGNSEISYDEVSGSNISSEALDRLSELAWATTIGKTFVFQLPAEMTDEYTSLTSKSYEICNKNAKISLENKCNAAAARIRIKTDALFDQLTADINEENARKRASRRSMEH